MPMAGAPIARSAWWAVGLTAGKDRRFKTKGTAMDELTIGQREDVAAYLLDRADQYENESPCWVALSDAAENIMACEVERAKQNGELDQKLRQRVRALGGTVHAVEPSLGVEKG